jgi:hypothetical protein
VRGAWRPLDEENDEVAVPSGLPFILLSPNIHQQCLKKKKKKKTPAGKESKFLLH